MSTPILWSFRRCPYAMRARLAIHTANIQVELREVVLRDKPQEFLDASPSATVPCLVQDDSVIDESLDVMIWALSQNDPEEWLDMPREGRALIESCDGAFKTSLDHYKYPTRYQDIDPVSERTAASEFLLELEQRLNGRAWLLADDPKLADMAILPFVRQFAHVDLQWFDAQPWPNLTGWLEAFKTSQRFTGIMQKYPQWQAGDPPLCFPEQ